MKRVFYLSVLFCCGLLCASGCQKDQPTPSVTIDIKVPDPIITTVSSGSKKLDFTIEVTQTGDFYYQDFSFKFAKPDGSLVLDSYVTQLPSAHEFVHRSVVAPPGTYMVTVFIGPSDSGSGSGSTVVVPQ